MRFLFQAVAPGQQLFTRATSQSLCLHRPKWNVDAAITRKTRKACFPKLWRSHGYKHPFRMSSPMPQAAFSRGLGAQDVQWTSALRGPERSGDAPQQAEKRAGSTCALLAEVRREYVGYGLPWLFLVL